MDALIKVESPDFATLNFENVVKKPEISHFFRAIRVFLPCERPFFAGKKTFVRDFRSEKQSLFRAEQARS